MKNKTFIALAGTALALLGGASAAGATGITWAPSFSTAQKESAASGKVMMVNFYTDWCVWCKTLDAKVYPDPRVVAAASPFIAVKINAEKGGDFLAQTYNITSYPTLLFLDADGNIEDEIGTYAPPKQFAELLRGVKGDILAYHALEAQSAADPNNPNIAAHLASAYATRGRLDDAVQQVNIAEANGGSKLLAHAYNAVGDVALTHQEDHDAAVYYQKALKIATEPEEVLSSRLGLAQTSADRGDKPGLLQQLKSAAQIPGLSVGDRRHVADIIKQVEASS